MKLPQTFYKALSWAQAQYLAEFTLVFTKSKTILNQTQDKTAH